MGWIKAMVNVPFECEASGMTAGKSTLSSKSSQTCTGSLLAAIRNRELDGPLPEADRARDALGT